MHSGRQAPSIFYRCYLLLKRPVSARGLAGLMALVLMAPGALAAEMKWASLNLSEEQANEIARLESEWERTHEEVSAQIDSDMAELRSILPNGDTERIKQLQNRITNNKMYLMNTSMETFLKKRESLTPAQRRDLQKIMPVRSRH